MTKQYGVWMTIQHFACENGGDDIVGSLEDITAKAKEWNEEESHKNHPDTRVITYETKEYPCQYLAITDNGIGRCELISGHEEKHMIKGEEFDLVLDIIQ